MTDIVERLRAEYREWGEAFHADAADEIERLRAQMESGNYLTENDKLSLAIERQALEIKERDDEIERLRQIVQLGVEVRTRQKVYFKSRDRGDLIASKEAESAFDKAAKP